MKYFLYDKEYEDIIINTIECTFCSECNESGPIFQIWRYPYSAKGGNKLYATAVLERKGELKWEFNIEVTEPKVRRNGLGTFLMKKVSEWAHENHLKYIYGFLSVWDKDKNWQTSLPFYDGLPKKNNKIVNCYFVENLEDALENPAKHALCWSDLNNLDKAFVSFEIVGYIETVQIRF